MYVINCMKRETKRGKQCPEAVFDTESTGKTDVNLNFSVMLLCGMDSEKKQGPA